MTRKLKSIDYKSKHLPMTKTCESIIQSDCVDFVICRCDAIFIYHPIAMAKLNFLANLYKSFIDHHW